MPTFSERGKSVSVSLQRPGGVRRGAEMIRCLCLLDKDRLIPGAFEEAWADSRGRNQPVGIFSSIREYLNQIFKCLTYNRKCHHGESRQVAKC